MAGHEREQSEKRCKGIRSGDQELNFGMPTKTPRQLISDEGF
jgi:hypothetical protein